jgi:energy-coupling factor transport system ATP-binding protein
MSISIKDLSYEGENNKKILKKISFDVNKGEYCFFIGETGSGKTTILEILMGLLPGNNVEIFGENLFNKKNTRFIQKKISYVFQRCEAQFFETTVEKEIKISGDLTEAVEILNLLSLDYNEIKKKSPFELSGGEKKKLAIVIALLKKPKILLLDEPTTGLDGRSSLELLKFLKKLNKDGLTIIQTTHIMEEVMDYATKTIVIKKGEVVYDGKDVFQQEELLDRCRLEIPFKMKLINSLNKKNIYLKNHEIENFVMENLC